MPTRCYASVFTRHTRLHLYEAGSRKWLRFRPYLYSSNLNSPPLLPLLTRLLINIHADRHPRSRNTHHFSPGRLQHSEVGKRKTGWRTGRTMSNSHTVGWQSLETACQNTSIVHLIWMCSYLFFHNKSFYQLNRSSEKLTVFCRASHGGHFPLVSF